MGRHGWTGQFFAELIGGGTGAQRQQHNHKPIEITRRLAYMVEFERH